MKHFILSLSLVMVTVALSAQLNPVSWTFSAKKTGDKQYELTATAFVQNTWHLYSQTQPADAVAEPTSFKFKPNPLVSLEGKVKETGKLEKFTDAKLGVSANQYSGTVSFTQKVRLKGKARTSISGTVTYQTCDDHKCLPPKNIPFTVALN